MIINIELLAVAIADGMSYHVFQGGNYAGRSFYYPASATEFCTKNPGFKIKYLTNRSAVQERKWA